MSRPCRRCGPDSASWISAVSGSGILAIVMNGTARFIFAGSICMSNGTRPEPLISVQCAIKSLAKFNLGSFNSIGAASSLDGYAQKLYHFPSKPSTARGQCAGNARAGGLPHRARRGMPRLYQAFSKEESRPASCKRLIAAQRVPCSRAVWSRKVAAGCDERPRTREYGMRFTGKVLCTFAAISLSSPDPRRPHLAYAPFRVRQ